jgi:hypothetical protein
MQVVDDLGTWLRENSYSLSDVALPAAAVVDSQDFPLSESVEDRCSTYEALMQELPVVSPYVSDSANLLSRACKHFFMHMYSDDSGLHVERVFPDMFAEETDVVRKAGNYIHICLEGRSFVDPLSPICDTRLTAVERKQPQPPAKTIREITGNEFYRKIEDEQRRGLQLYDSDDLIGAIGEPWEIGITPVFGFNSFVVERGQYSDAQEMANALAESAIGNLVGAVRDARIRGLMMIPRLTIGMFGVENRGDHTALGQKELKCFEDVLEFPQVMVNYHFAATGVRKAS